MSATAQTDSYVWPAVGRIDTRRSRTAIRVDRPARRKLSERTDRADSVTSKLGLFICFGDAAYLTQAGEEREI